jgi:signal transduction histidine kinase
LLALARMDESDSPWQHRQLRLDELLADLAAAANAALPAGRARVICTDMPATTVRGDADELAQLFRNLIDNALGHGPHDGIVTMSISAGDDSSVAVAVHDEGGLIPHEALGRLFDRFYRADPSRASATGGTGLGLAIVREIVRRHSGQVEITSTPATGTTVTVRLAGE